MSDHIYKREDCRLCHSTNLECVLEYKPTPLCDAYITEDKKSEEQAIYPLDLYLCRDCGFSQLLDIVQPQVIYFNYLYETKTSLGLVEHFKSYADDVVTRLDLKEGSQVLDIGSNDGTLLEYFKTKGMNVLGVDPAVEIAKRATDRGIETLAELFNKDLGEKIKSERSAADVVTINNLFANVDQLDDMVEGVKSVLADDGVFVFESFYMKNLIEHMVFDFIYHEHISCFAVKPVQAFFKRHGLHLFDVQHVETKGGSLRYFIQWEGGSRAESDIVNQYIREENEFGLDDPDTFKKFENRIDAIKNEVTTYVQKLKSEGKTVAGYGASATTTTFLYHFELTDLIDFIVDDVPERQGRFSPGKHIPVVSSKEMYAQKPDCVLVIAWRYFDPIIAKHQKYLEEGGQFVIPLPNFRIVEESGVIN